MQRLVLLVIVAILGWYGYNHYSARPRAQFGAVEPTTSATLLTSGSQYKCDGRIYCSQMTSCEEATYFLRNCPGVKMDGNNDGVPCEQQWCRR